MEASTLYPAPSLPRPRVAIGGTLLRLRSDEQLVALFRAGSEEAFSAIHDRYHKRLFAYARQMLPARQDAEDALQDVFVRAYSGLRASSGDLALRAWLFRVAHNRCIDELRKPSPPPPEVLQLVRCTVHDPLVEVDLKESLRRLVTDIRRLPDQQRSALLMRELGGMSYAELSALLGISVGAVKSLLVRARLALAEAAEARDTACAVIREQLVEAHDHGIRPSATARKHMRDCVGCKSFRRELRGVSRQLAAMAPTLGPLGFLANLLGFSGGAGSTAGGTGGGAAVLGGGGVTASAGGLALGANHVATLLVAAVATAGGAVEIQHSILPAAPHRAVIRAAPATSSRRSAATALPHRTAVEIEKRGTSAMTPGVGTTKAAAHVPGGAATTTTRHSRHPRRATRPNPVPVNSPAVGATSGNALPSSVTSDGPITVTTGAQPSANCPTTGAPGVATGQTSTPASAPAIAAATGSAPAGSGTTTTPSTAPTSCGPTTAGPSTDTATSSAASSSPAGSPAPPSSSSTGTGSAPTPASASNAGAAGSNPSPTTG